MSKDKSKEKNGEHEKDCEWPLEVKEMNILFFRCKHCDYFKTIAAEKDWKVNKLEIQ
jgi:hypothetical protein